MKILFTVADLIEFEDIPPLNLNLNELEFPHNFVRHLTNSRILILTIFLFSEEPRLARLLLSLINLKWDQRQEKHFTKEKKSFFVHA